MLWDMFHEIEQCILSSHGDEAHDGTSYHKDTPVEGPFHITYWRDNPPRAQERRENAAAARKACTPQAL